MAIRSDHYKHFFVCFMVSALGTVPWQIWHEGWMLALPVGLGLLAGFCKEFADIGGSGFDCTEPKVPSTKSYLHTGWMYFSNVRL